MILSVEISRISGSAGWASSKVIMMHYAHSWCAMSALDARESLWCIISWVSKGQEWQWNVSTHDATWRSPFMVIHSDSSHFKRFSMISRVLLQISWYPKVHQLKFNYLFISFGPSWLLLTPRNLNIYVFDASDIINRPFQQNKHFEFKHRQTAGFLFTGLLQSSPQRQLT